MVDEGRKYKVIETLGKGGFGVVYRAELVANEGFQKQVAVKILRPREGFDTEQAETRFRDEARILGLINHRAVVKVDGMVELDAGLAVIMEYVHGVNVSTLVKLGGVPIRVALTILDEVASALHAAYTLPNHVTGRPLELVHRDIKPGNIRITPQGEVKVLDFGVARAAFDNRESETTEMRFGSLTYMSPERLDGIEGPACDIYALGLVVAELITGERFGEPPKHAQRHDDFVGTIEANVRESASTSAASPAAIERLVALVRSMLSYEDKDRPDAGAVMRQVRGLALDFPGEDLRAWSERHVQRLVDRRPVRRDEDLSDSILIETKSGQPRMQTAEAPLPVDLSDESRARDFRVAVLSALFTGVGTLVVLAAVAWFSFPLEQLTTSTIPPEPPMKPAQVDPPSSSPAEEPAPSKRTKVAAVPKLSGIRKGMPPAEPMPEKAPPAPATVSVSGDASSVALVSTQGSHTLGDATKVPAGTYSVRARFSPTDFQPAAAGEITLVPGDQVTLHCDAKMFRCSKR